MTDIEARVKIKGKNYEVLVDVDKALQLKKGVSANMENILAVDEVFHDSKKGLRAGDAELEDSFGTSDVLEIGEKIIKSGELVLPAEYREKGIEEKRKQLVNFLVKNAFNPQSGNPHTESRIEEALNLAGINVENKSIEQQIGGILSKLKEVIPIKIETKKLKISVPAVHTGKVYGFLQNYKEKEDWLGNGDLVVVINIPAGLQMDFYDKLNNITHGSAIVEEIKEQ